MTPQDTRYCTCCKKHLPNYEFGRSAATKDGIQNRCYSCNREAFYKNKDKVRSQVLAELELKRKMQEHIPILNSTSREPYNPKTNTFYRNEGHKHILSRGTPC